jgi:hypothetical protein
MQVTEFSCPEGELFDKLDAILPNENNDLDSDQVDSIVLAMQVSKEGKISGLDWEIRWDKEGGQGINVTVQTV